MTGKVYHADLWGLRERKYGLLEAQSVESTPWRELDPQGPAYLFVPQEDELRAEYEQGWSVTNAFDDANNGLVTARDHLCVHFKDDELWNTLQAFISLNVHDARQRFGLRADTRDWRVEWAQTDVKDSGPNKEYVSPLLYRPFDFRSTYYTGTTRGFICMPRTETMMQVVRHTNLALLATRVTKDDWGVLSSKCAIGHKALSAYDITSLFPLYLYPVKPDDPRTEAPGGRRPNLSPEFIAACEARWGLKFVINGKGDLGLGSTRVPAGDSATARDGRAPAEVGTFGPEDVFHYMYAVFHAPGYRARYSEFLKRDFPRLPLTGDLDLLRALCRLGEALTRLHLMDPSAVDTSRFKQPEYPVLPNERPLGRDASGHLLQGEMNLHLGGGGDMVEKVRYTPPHPGSPDALIRADDNLDHSAGMGHAGCQRDVHPGRVWINAYQYFEGVAEEVWSFRVGGYQPCEKWLKDRKGRTLSYDDVEHYRLMVAIIAQTISLMGEIDAVIEAYGGWPLK